MTYEIPSQETSDRLKLARLEYEVNNLINSLRSVRGELEDVRRDFEKLRQEKRAAEVHYHYHNPSGYYYWPSSSSTFTVPMEPGKIYPITKEG